jgi:hypothetical protein
MLADAPICRLVKARNVFNGINERRKSVANIVKYTRREGVRIVERETNIFDSLFSFL